MKLKSLFLVSLFSFLLIPCFSSAYEIIDQGKVLVDIPSDFSLNSNDYSFNYYGNITTDGSSYFEWKNSHGSFYLDYLYGWIDGKLYFYSYESESNRSSQGFVDSFWKTNNLTFTRNFNYSATDFYNLNPDITKIVFGNDTTSITYSDKYWTFYLCFFNNNDSYYYCAGGAPILRYEEESYSTFTGSLGFLSVDNAKDGNWGSSPFFTPDTFYFSTGSCPSVGQLKSSSNLTPAVCYGGYGPNVMYGDQVAFVGGSGMSIFDVYNDYLTTFSDHSMDIQTFYDTYWSYYQNIAQDSRPFEGLKKSYLGLQFARQTFGNTRGVNGSYMILNYCYYVVNNVPDNTSTCVGSNISTQYSGVVITDQDKKDILDAVNDNYTVHTPGTGSIFNDPNAGLGGGGSSWGDEECKGIPCLFDKFYQMFTSSRINDVNFSAGGQGILPQYIALAFVVVVLFYVFKR